ncbi:S-adenosylmethionine-dependent methyltransferase [Trapelia coarctata]|nr:S-adenosylmethionine-dependent methyltransferase [Trapelia coarctata]
MLPTPSTSHINTDRIYEPAEDSYLLLDTLSSVSEIAFLKRRFNPLPTSTPSPSPPPFRPTGPPFPPTQPSIAPLVLEIGPGSGVVLAFLTAHAETLFGCNVLTLGVDINRYACAATTQTVREACADQTSGSGSFIGALLGDLSSPLRAGEVDMLVFNPPYVPTSSVPELGVQDTAETKTAEERLLELSWAGGKDGMEVSDRLLDQLPQLLSKQRGVAYILLCQQNRPNEVLERIRAWGAGWAVDVVGRSGRMGGWEKLQVLRIWRNNHQL